MGQLKLKCIKTSLVTISDRPDLEPPVDESTYVHLTPHCNQPCCKICMPNSCSFLIVCTVFPPLGWHFGLSFPNLGGNTSPFHMRTIVLFLSG